MMSLYPQIRSLHILLIAASGALFALRGAAALFGMRWPRWSWVKWGSITLDTFLLTTAAMLYTMLPKAMFANGWLSLKLALVVVYIVLGILSMRDARPRWQRALFYVAALVCFATIIGIARMHSPSGWALLLR